MREVHFSTRSCEVRLRVAAKAARHPLAEAIVREVESLYTNGPAAAPNPSGK
jgi:hypothetical protein